MKQRNADLPITSSLHHLITEAFKSSCSLAFHRLQAELIGHRPLDDSTLEEIRIAPRMQPRGVGERELPEILLGHVALLYHFERFGNHFLEIRHVEMREVGTEHRSQPHA